MGWVGWGEAIWGGAGAALVLELQLVVARGAWGVAGGAVAAAAGVAVQVVAGEGVACAVGLAVQVVAGGEVATAPAPARVCPEREGA